MKFEQFVEYLQNNNFKLLQVKNCHCSFGFDNKEFKIKLIVDLENDLVSIYFEDTNNVSNTGYISFEECKKGLDFLFNKPNEYNDYKKENPCNNDQCTCKRHNEGLINELTPDVSSFHLVLNKNIIEINDKLTKEKIGKIEFINKQSGYFEFNKIVNANNCYRNIYEKQSFSNIEELKTLIYFYNEKNYLINKDIKEYKELYKNNDNWIDDEIKSKTRFKSKEDQKENKFEELPISDIDKSLPASPEDIYKLYDQLKSFQNLLDYMLNRFEKLK